MLLKLLKDPFLKIQFFIVLPLVFLPNIARDPHLLLSEKNLIGLSFVPSI